MTFAHGPASDVNSGSWFTAEVQLLQGQMAALQTALESSKHAVESFHRRAAANIEASEQRYRDLFNNVLTGIYRMSPDGKLLLANPAFLRILGYASLEEMAPVRFTPPYLEEPNDSAEHVLGLEREWKTKDGDIIMIRESARSVRDAGGGLLYYEGAIEDVTGQKKAAMFEQDCRQLLERVTRNEPLAAIFNDLTLLIERQAPGRVCSMLLMRDGRLYPAAGASLPEEYIESLEGGVPIGPECGSCGTAAYYARPVVVSNIATDPLWKSFVQLANPYGFQSCWSVPICSGRGDVLGTFAVYRKESYHPSPAEIQIVETASRLAAVALEQRKLYQDLEEQATRDGLTGLPNRAAFEERLNKSVRNSEPFTLLWLDLDRFKEINETLGHRMGDDLIRQAARRLQRTVRNPGMVARISGDEFAMLLPSITDREGAEAFARRIVEGMQAPLHVNGFELFITASVGICIFPGDGRTADELVQNADSAMYRAKGLGKNCFAFYEQAMSVAARDRMEIEVSLRRALERNELELFYQPQVDIGGELKGMEALLRWRHPQRGILTPGHFITIAEETGLIVPIGTWVLEEACRQCKKWQRPDGPPVKVAVNVSMLQFYFSDLPEVVRMVLNRTGLDPRCLELELTETLVMKNSDESAQALSRIRELGVTVAIDDFGTGYSSLAYLQRLPLDLLKIDRSFFVNVEAGPAAAMIHAITMLAHSLGLRVVAEGIETETQLEAARKAGIDFAQGYLIGHPLPADAATRTIEALIVERSAA